MKIIFSCHFDVAKPVMFITLDKHKLSGLVDNLAGIFIAYRVSRKTGVKVYFTNFEEAKYEGARAVSRRLKKEKEEGIVVVIDVVRETDSQGKQAYIGNVYGFNIDSLKEKFQDRIFFKDGFFEQEEDETYIYGKTFGLKTFFFGIPIPKDYHDTDNFTSLKTVDQAEKALFDVVSFLKNKR